MKVYATSKNHGPESSMYPRLVYLGTSIQEAEDAVGDFRKYAKPEDPFAVNYPDLYSAIPRDLEREMIQYFMADGWWYSIVMFELDEP